MQASFRDADAAVVCAERALARVRERFSLEAMAEGYLAILGAEAVPGPMILGAEACPAHAKMPACNSATAPAAPAPSSSVPSPMTAAS
jgi:hypothetical protein